MAVDGDRHRVEGDLPAGAVPAVATARSTSSSRATGVKGSSVRCSVARSTSSVTRSLSSLDSAAMTASRRSRSSGSMSWPRSSSSALVRRLVSGRAQLVAGVLDELVLLAAGVGQRPEHGVEGPGQAPDLVVALDGDGGGQVLGGGHLLGGVGQGPDRAGDAAGHQPTDGAGQGGAGQGDQEQAPAESGEDVVGLGQLPGDLHGAARLEVGGEDPEVDAVDGDRAQPDLVGPAATARSASSTGRS